MNNITNRRVSPLPLDASHEPTSSIKRLPASAAIEDILAILEEDGGLILTGLVSSDQLENIDREVEDYREKAPATEGTALAIIPKETIAIQGLVGKSATVAELCELPVLETLRERILEDRFSVLREDRVEENCIDPLLSISTTLHIGYGAPRQIIHRDDNIHGIRHGGPFVLNKQSQFACLIAGSKTTRQNGATMFIPGSHKWDDQRVPKLEEVCFAEMDPGSALIFLGAAYHGGGANQVPDFIRKMHGLFFIRGTLRTEENQFLAIPREKVLTMSPKMLSLLGYKKPTTVLGIVESQDPAADLQATFSLHEKPVLGKRDSGLAMADGVS